MAKQLTPPDGCKLYPITRFQKVISLQEQYALRKEVSNIPFLITFGEKLDFDLLEKAVDEEIKRNDVLRVFGYRKDKELFQYFVPEYHIDKIKRLDFTGKTEEQQYKALEKISDKPIFYCKTESYKFVFVTTYNGRDGVYFVQNHMLNDTVGIMIVINDLMQVYYAMKNGTEMPKPLGKFEDFVINKLNLDPEKIEKDRAFFREFHTQRGKPFYNGPFGDRNLVEFQKKKKDDTLNECPNVALFNNKTKIRRLKISGEEYANIKKTCEDYKISVQTFAYMLIRLQTGRASTRGETCMYNSVTSINRATLTEKRTSGMALNNYSAHTNYSNDMTLEMCYKETAKMYADFYWHRSLPGTEILLEIVDDIYPHINPLYGYNTGTISVVPATFSGAEGVDYEFMWIPPTTIPSPMFTVVSFDDYRGEMVLNAQYLTKFVRDSEVDAMIEGYKKLVPLMTANPTKTIGEIIEMSKK